MNCNPSAGAMRTGPNPAVMQSDAFGNGCEGQCQYPLDCGQYPQFTFRAYSMGPCLSQPPYAESRLGVNVCESCQRQPVTDTLTHPQKLLLTATRSLSSC